MTYQDALDHIFESFLAAKSMIAGKLDRDVRDPEILLSVARDLDLIPPPEKILKVTGSKGKGTVARLCAHGLSNRAKVGLVISPEEFDHTDRMSINGKAISKSRFVACYKKIKLALPDLIPPQYLSPYGLFLLIALQWFSEENLDYIVIETGRGVRFDEGGQLPAKVGVVTSIFLEHAGYLGPTLSDISQDKMSIADHCETVISPYEGEVGISNDFPIWFSRCQIMAQQALSAFLGEAVPVPDGVCASFGRYQDGSGRLWIYEGIIASESADRDFLKKIVPNAVFYLSLPDDKDFDGVMRLLSNLGAEVHQVILRGERGFMDYTKAAEFSCAYEGAYDDVDAFRTGLVQQVKPIQYFIGTQTFLRLVKQAFFHDAN